VSESWGTPGGGWGNPAFGSTSLRLPAMNSPNFNLANPTASPSPSWAVLASGLAYFFGVVLSGGTVTGPDYIINPAGIFWYSGTPALGNLIGYWALTSAAGTDQFGNAYNPGLYVGNPATGPQVALVPGAGSAAVKFPVFPASFFSQIANITAENLSSGGQLFISGAALSQSGFTDWVQLALWSYQGTTAAHLDANYVDASAAPHTYESVSYYGSKFFAVNSLYGVHPGSGTSQTNAASSESWQTPGLDNGWAVGGPIPGGIRYRLIPLGAGVIEIEGDIYNPVIGVPSFISVAAVFDSAYISALNGRTRNIDAGYNQRVTNNSASNPWVYIDNAGNINVVNYQLGNTEMFFHGFIPLD
jgi:hypothetical protein